MISLSDEEIGARSLFGCSYGVFQTLLDIPITGLNLWLRFDPLS
jgi:hypothetical protein